MSLSISGVRLSSPVAVNVTLTGADDEFGGGEAGGDDAPDAEAEAGEEPTAESRLVDDSEPEVERRRGGGAGRARDTDAAGMWREAVITQLSSSEPPIVWNKKHC